MVVRIRVRVRVRALEEIFEFRSVVISDWLEYMYTYNVAYRHEQRLGSVV